MIDYEHYENLELEPGQPRSRASSQPPRRIVTARRAERIPQSEEGGAHFQIRAAERYGHQLSWRELKRLIRSIARGEATLVARESMDHSIWDVHVPPHIMRVVYNDATRRIITILPPHLITQSKEN